MIAMGVIPYALVILHPSVDSFSPDSWAYYDLSRTVFHDFYHAAAQSFNEHDGYSRSFPPLWPVLIALADRIFQLGPRIAVSLAALAALFTVIPIHLVFTACIPQRRLAGIATTTTWLSLLWFEPYWTEARAGRSLPLTILLLLGAVACLLGHRTAKCPPVSLVAGLLLGCACLARFDSLFFSGIVMAVVLAVPSTRLSSKLLMITAFCIAISPWIVYSVRHYNTPWASDNSSMALKANETSLLDYKTSPETAFTHPRKWATRIALNGLKLLREAGRQSAKFPLSPLILAFAWTLWRLSRRPGARVEPGQKQLLLFVGAALAGLAGQVLTGYMDPRYFTFLCLLATCWVACAALSRKSPIRVVASLWIFISLPMSTQALWWTAQESRNTSPSLETLARAEQTDVTPSDLKAVVLAKSTLCNEYGALTRQPTVCLPRDWSRLTQTEREEFVSLSHVTFALLGDPASRQPRPGTERLQIVPIKDAFESLTSH
jgi:hypothetical protein